MRTALLLFICLRAGAADLKAIGEFASLAKQSAALFPVAARVGYRSCVASQRYMQMRAAAFNQDFVFDQKQIEQQCVTARETGMRLESEYHVLDQYLIALGNLAGYDTKKIGQSLSTAAVTIQPLAGSSAEQISAVGGLVSLIGKLVAAGSRARELAVVIPAAQPHVHVICTTFAREIARLEEGHLRSLSETIGSLYQEAAARSPQTSPILLTINYQRDLRDLERERERLKAFSLVFEKIDESHAKLAAAGSRLFSKQFRGELNKIVADLVSAAAAADQAFQPL